MSSRSTRLSQAIVACAASLVSCTSVLGIEDTKYEEPAAPLPEEWKCVGTPNSAPSVETINLKVKTTEFFSPTEVAVPGVEVRACTLFEPDCNAKAPLGVTEIPDPNDPKSMPILSVSMPVSGSFTGYLQLSDPTEAHKTLRWLFSQPVTTDIDLPVQMAGAESLKAFVGMQTDPEGGTLVYDPTKGLLTFSVVNCITKGGVQQSGANVSVHVDVPGADAKTYYFDGQAFNHSSVMKTTNEKGQGAVFNLDPGKVTMTVKYGDTVVATQKNIPIVADTITTINMFPDRAQK